MKLLPTTCTKYELSACEILRGDTGRFQDPSPPALQRIVNVSFIPGSLYHHTLTPINTMSWALWIQSNIGNSYLFSVIFILLRIILYLSSLVEQDFIPPVPNVHGTIIPSSGEEAEVIFIQEIHYFSRFHLLPGIELVC